MEKRFMPASPEASIDTIVITFPKGKPQNAVFAHTCPTPDIDVALKACLYD